ncbi:hypothetical protein BCR44DRAFT_1485656 [Catenaria anguillulae PL171]|uniref:Uncharacterized protein n=1 Tax=Catenaria anguillulae PL171 TaxID=765915 RepID=A0A1Y2HM30_9FUNG|nr:hypothetical protein BCR44DRAFT_1485656 [Catenaria anguillulae PL171]
MANSFVQHIFRPAAWLAWRRGVQTQFAVHLSDLVQFVCPHLDERVSFALSQYAPFAASLLNRPIPFLLHDALHMLPKHVSAQSWAGICDRVLAGAAASGLQWSITNRAAHTAPGAERIWIVDDVSLDRAKHKPRAERDSAGAEGRRAKDKSTERTNTPQHHHPASDHGLPP